MKTKIIFSYLLLAVSLISNAQIKFMDQPEGADVAARAKELNKYILLDAYTNWCGWCKVMDKTTFKDSAVIDYLNKNFVCVKMEMETGFGIDLAKKYRVNAFPSYLVFTQDGKYVDRMLGYSKAPKFISGLKKIMDIPMRDYPTGMNQQISMPFPELYNKRFEKDKDGHHHFADSATVAKFLAGQKDLSEEVAWSVLCFADTAMPPYYPWILDNAGKLRKLYGATEVDAVIGDIIAKKFEEAKAKKDENALEQLIFPMLDKYITTPDVAEKPLMKIQFYQAVRKFDKLAVALKEYADLPDPDGDYHESLNQTCWDLYEKCDDEKVLLVASAIMKKVTDAEPKWALMDTYASLLYKLKDYKTAEDVASKAIETGLKANEKVKPTQELLEKIKAAGKGK